MHDAESPLSEDERGQLTRRQLLTVGGALAAAPTATAAAWPEFIGKPTLAFQSEYLFSRRSLVTREVIGEVAEGFRIDIVTGGGRVRGPAFNGTCVRGGDWFLVRRDGVGIVDSRVTLQAYDGAIIDSFYSGVVDLGADAFARLIKGETPTPGAIHIAARFQTSAPQYAWLNRIQAIGIGRSYPDGNLWDTYALR